MTVNFQTTPSHVKPVVFYDTEPHGDDTAAYRYTATGVTKPIQGIQVNRVAHAVNLTGLEPDTTYFFVAGPEGGPYMKPGSFRTLKQNPESLRFIVGGDMGIFPLTRRLAEQVGLANPDFIVIGGDLAYANGEAKNLWIWDAWLRIWKREMVRADGTIIPAVFAIGNHEVNDLEGAPEEIAPYFHGFFEQGGSTYFLKRFGDLLAMYVLDSGHVIPVEGAQTKWLASMLEENADAQYQMAVYHVPMYPSHRSYDDARSVAQREHWLPLFDQFGIDVGWEHHDHTHKRTHRMINSEPHPEGTLYLGDGSMGVPPRNINNADAPYLATASSTGHFWLVEIDREKATYKAIDRHGEVFDQYPEP
jgi:hypothetical protein